MMVRSPRPNWPSVVCAIHAVAAGSRLLILICCADSHCFPKFSRGRAHLPAKEADRCLWVRSAHRIWIIRHTRTR